MKDQINTVREGIKAALGAEVFVDKPIRRALLDALTALSNLESHLAQYEAGDMASAAAQGFRDGVASVAQQPQAKSLFAEAIAKHLGLREGLKAMDEQPQAEPISVSCRCFDEVSKRLCADKSRCFQAFAASAAPQQAEAVPSDVVRDAMVKAACDAVAAALGDAYDCTRVWEAWNSGTMGQDAFYLVSEDSDRVREIAVAAIDAAMAQGEKP